MWWCLFFSLLWICTVQGYESMVFPDSLIPEQYDFELFLPEELRPGEIYHGNGILRATTTFDLYWMGFGLHYDGYEINLISPYVSVRDPRWDTVKRIFPKTSEDKFDDSGNFTYFTLEKRDDDPSLMGVKVSIFFAFKFTLGTNPGDGIYLREHGGNKFIISHFKHNRMPKVFPCVNLPTYKAFVNIVVKSKLFADQREMQVLSNQPMEFLYDPDNYFQGMWQPVTGVNFPIPTSGVGFAIGKFHKRGWCYTDLQRRPVYVLSIDPGETNDHMTHCWLFAQAWDWLEARIGPQRKDLTRDNAEHTDINILIIDDEPLDEETFRGPQVYNQLVLMPKRYIENWDDTTDPSWEWKREEIRYQIVRSAYDHWFFYSIIMWKYKNLFFSQGLSSYFALDYLYEQKDRIKLDVMGMYLEEHLNDVFSEDTVAHNDTAKPLVNLYDTVVNVDELDTMFATYKSTQWLRQMANFRTPYSGFVEGVKAMIEHYATTYKQELRHVVPVQQEYFDYSDLSGFVEKASQNPESGSTNDAIRTIDFWASTRFYPVVHLMAEKDYPSGPALTQNLYIPATASGQNYPTQFYPIPVQFTDQHQHCFFIFAIILNDSGDRLNINCDQTRERFWYHVSNNASNYYKVLYNDYLMEQLLNPMQNKLINYLDRFTIVRDFRIREKIPKFPLWVQRIFQEGVMWENQIIVWNALEELLLSAALDGNNYESYLLQNMYEGILLSVGKFNDFTTGLWGSPLGDVFTTNRINETINDINQFAEDRYHPYSEKPLTQKFDFEDYFQGYLNGSIPQNTELFPKRSAFRRHASKFGADGFNDLKEIFERTEDEGEKKMVLEAMVRTEDVEVLEKNFDFILQETIKRKIQKYVFKGALRNPVATKFIETYFKGKPPTKTSRRFHILLSARRGGVLGNDDDFKESKSEDY
ncbi:hypothetical protein QR680_007880 [Steinernema hermaphroditum]|uniref:Aminopeptidase n=1 Tax=Steinernema hermaphroditum TaxID=289476 RepID=A0AA39IGY6_9BILA|nr:hypothetical protein QR680_007880 [Steinernema hermaphroditum]